MPGPDPQHEPEEYIAAVDGGDMVGTQDVADELDCSYELAYKRLNELADDGELARQRVANTIIWTVNDQ